MIATDTTFRAVADPTRRTILDALACGDRTVTDLCALFDVSQPRISQQLQVLRDAGLVRVRREGRLAWYSLEAEPLRELHDWAGHYEKFWRSRLELLGGVLDRAARQTRKRRP